MENITVGKAELLEKLRSNRDDHRANFETAMEGYRSTVVHELEQRLAQVRRGEKINLKFHLPEPQSFVDDYDTAIGMLEWETRDKVQLNKYDFEKYVLNVWDWTHSFTASTSAYTASRP